MAKQDSRILIRNIAGMSAHDQGKVVYPMVSTDGLKGSYSNNHSYLTTELGLRLICRHNLRNNRYHFIRELFCNNRSLVSIKFIKRSSAHAIDYSAY